MRFACLFMYVNIHTVLHSRNTPLRTLSYYDCKRGHLFEADNFFWLVAGFFFMEMSSTIRNIRAYIHVIYRHSHIRLCKPIAYVNRQ
jgi:hypothetical protein